MAKAQETIIDDRTDAEKRFDSEFEAGFPVKMAILHQALHCPGLPAERTLMPAKIAGIQMSWTKAGLFIKAPIRSGVFKRVGVAQANVGNFEI